MNELVAELALGRWIGALNGVVTNLIVLQDLGSTALTTDLHEEALVKFVGSHNQLIVGQLVLACIVVASETYLVQVVDLQLVEGLQSAQGLVAVAFARRVEELSTGALLPGLIAWLAEVMLAGWALLTLDNDV